MPDNVTLYRDDLSRLLPEGEKPLVMVRVRSAYGSDRVRRSPEERLDKALRGAPRAVRERATAQARDAGGQNAGRHPVFDFFVKLVTFDAAIPTPDWKRLFGGVTLTGSPGSYADRLNTPIETATSSLACVITDRRLVLVKNEVRSLTHVFDVPRQVIVNARRTSRGLSRSRVLLEFADASSITLHAGFFSAGGPAKKLAQALTRAG